MEELIIAKARALFCTYGLKSISMDDLAREAGISKKTIYQVVADKAELVLKVVQQVLDGHKAEVERCSLQAQNAIEEVALQTHVSFAPVAAINQAFFYDLEKSFPEAWLQVQAHRRWHLKRIAQNLQRGMEEGLYRTDLNLDLVPHIRLQQLQLLLQPSALAGAGPLAGELMLFYLHGIASPEGSRLIEKYATPNKQILHTI